MLLLAKRTYEASLSASELPMLTCLPLLTLFTQDEEGLWDMPSDDNCGSLSLCVEEEELGCDWDDVPTGESSGLVGDTTDFSCLAADTQAFKLSVPSEASVRQQVPFTGAVAPMSWENRWYVCVVFKGLGISKATYRPDIWTMIEATSAAVAGEGAAAGGEDERSQFLAGLEVWGAANERERFLLIRECVEYLGHPGLEDERQKAILFG